ncbi:MAG TPA: beta-ketoacyl-ACP synthase I, partial [Gammaproteobacteria bacterium]|nr:beta-ketoacyl-ACP synthase I [Gammaproteobacteria bacterium]
MRRVVITGMGIVSSIGNNCSEVAASLRCGRSGIVLADEYRDLNFRSQVHGSIDIDLDQLIERKLKRFMGGSAAYNYIAMREAVEGSGLTEADVSNPRT